MRFGLAQNLVEKLDITPCFGGYFDPSRAGLSSGHDQVHMRKRRIGPATAGPMRPGEAAIMSGLAGLLDGRL